MELQTLERKLGRIKQSQTIRGAGNPHWKGGQVTKYCVRCGSEFKVYPSTSNRTHCSLICANRDLADAQKGIVNPKKIHYGEANGNWEKGYRFIGELNPSWKGGRTEANRLLRNHKRYRGWHDKVFKRDNYTCQKCGKRGGNLHAHHIKSFALHPKLRLDLENGLTLCVPCHRKTFMTVASA